MRRSLLLAGALVSLGMPAQAQDYDTFETIRRCRQNVLELNYEDGYAKGKFHAQAFQTALNQKDWSEEDKPYLDTSRFTSRHGLGGMTSGAQLLIAMLYAKMDGEPWNARSRTNACLMGEFNIYESQAWSAVHSGFTDHLSPELKILYFSLPTQ